MIRIRSSKDGFRRCGVPHPDKPTEYPDDHFTKKELEILKAEPKLFVEELPNTEPTVPELKAELDKLGVPYDAKAKKDELIALLKEAGKKE